MIVEAVQPLREGFPVPAQAQLHCSHRNGLDPGHQAHCRFPVFGLAGSEAKAALAYGYRRNAVPAGHGGVGFPVELEIIVSVQVDSPRSDDAAGGVQLLVGRSLDSPADHGDFAVLDCDVPAESRHSSGAVDNRTVAYNFVVFRHNFPSLSWRFGVVITLPNSNTPVKPVIPSPRACRGVSCIR